MKKTIAAALIASSAAIGFATGPTVASPAGDTAALLAVSVEAYNIKCGGYPPRHQEMMDALYAVYASETGLYPGQENFRAIARVQAHKTAPGLNASFCPTAAGLFVKILTGELF